MFSYSATVVHVANHEQDVLVCIPSIHKIAFSNISLLEREQSSEIRSIPDSLIEDDN